MEFVSFFLKIIENAPVLLYPSNTLITLLFFRLRFSPPVYEYISLLNANSQTWR